MFLLNDIIRYWRTICVDFEFKVRNDGKPRAIRLIKLRFSRMMLFIAGVLAIGETFNKDVEEKKKTLNDLFKMPAHERIKHIAKENADTVLELYANFLRKLNDKEVRDALSQKSPDGENTKEFESLRKNAHQFRTELFKLLTTHYPRENPTIEALML